MRFTLLKKHVLIPVVAFALWCGIVAPAAAATPGTGGWYWPTGTESFGGMSPWWSPRGSGHHLAQDMAAPCGRPVYAVGSGTVFSAMNIAGYGPGGSVGGAVIILHRTATGTVFKALYGHLKGVTVETGDTVAAGQIIGYINASSPNHLHFGIHPGSKEPTDGNEFRGHSYDSHSTYGWVDPVAFLRNNPRVIPYRAPALPVVASLTTTSMPLAPSAAAGAVWWQERSAEETTTWRFTFKSRLLERMSDETTIPVGDTRSYLVSVSGTRPGLVVRDLRPVVSRRLLDVTPRRGIPAVLTGTVRNASGRPFQGARVALERWTGSGWLRVGWWLTGLDGGYRATYTPPSSTALRVRFAPPAAYAAAASVVATVTPHVALTTPARSVAEPRRGSAFRLTSLLRPRHPESAVVEFQFERKVSGAWKRVVVKRALLETATGATICRTTAVCASSGDWRVRSYMPADAGDAASASAWSTFSVR